MKSLLVLTVMAFSLNSFANEVFNGTSQVGMATILLSQTTSGHPFLTKEEVIKDANEYHQNGIVSPKLAEQIKAIQSENTELSDNEAVDVLVDFAENL